MLTEKEYNQFKIGVYVLLALFCISALLLKLYFE